MAGLTAWLTACGDHRPNASDLVGRLKHDGYIKTRTVLEFQSQAALRQVKIIGSYRKDKLTIVLLALKPGVQAASNPQRMIATARGIEVTGFDEDSISHPSATLIRQFASTVRDATR